MRVTKDMRVELDASDIEEVLERHVAEVMRGQGCTLKSSKNESGTPQPDMSYLGESEG